MSLAVFACRSLCAWRATDGTDEGLRVFSCIACGSQWTRAQPWSPVDADGGRDRELLAELAAQAAAGVVSDIRADDGEPADRSDRSTTSGS